MLTKTWEAGDPVHLHPYDLNNPVDGEREVIRDALDFIDDHSWDCIAEICCGGVAMYWWAGGDPSPWSWL